MYAIVGTSRATSRRNSSATTQIEVVAEKSPQFQFCHCQNLTVPTRARLKLVHSSRLIQRKSLVSWWKKVEHCTQSRTHAMMQTIDFRFELSTVHVADNQSPVRIHAGKKTVIFDPVPTVIKQCLNSMQNSNQKKKFTNTNKTVFPQFPKSNQTVFATVMQTVFGKNPTFTNNDETEFKQ